MLPSLLEKWHQAFGDASPEVMIRAPGRVNIIGEHTDYNEGWVMPGAMSKSVYILVSRGNRDHHWIADNLNEVYKAAPNETANEMPVWAKYIQGALNIYDTAHRAFHILIGGDLPVGAGVSSSSSLVCGLLFGFQKLFGRNDTRETIAQLGSRVEREVIGLQGGIMDQFAIMLSKAHHVMLLDCRTQKYEFIAAEIPGCKWLLVNTKVRHQLIDSDYNERADECKRAVAIMQHQYPEIKNLRDVTPSMLSSTHLPSTLARRVKFILEENARVHDMVTALEKKDAPKAGQLLKASHNGLRNDYEVSCTELDHLADFANHFEGVHGARMMGGGFGGCVLCLVDKKLMDDFVEEIKASYFVKFNYDPGIIDVELGNGVEEIKQNKKGI